MGDALFHILALVVAAWGVFRGYRRGLTGVVTSVLGMAFGIVCAHIFGEALCEMLLRYVPEREDNVSREYFVYNLSSGLVFYVVYSVFRAVTGIISAAMADTASGLLNSLLGTAFCLFNYLLMLSICFNVIVGWNPQSSLMRYGKADDGNIIAAVMWIAPACLGGESFAEFAHKEQLRDARKISLNSITLDGVIPKGV